MIFLHLKCIQKRIVESDTEWDQYLDPIQFAIRTCYQASTKHTLFFLIYGKEVKLPLEVKKAVAIVDIDQLPGIHHRTDQISKVKDEIFSDVKANIIKAQNKQKEQYRKRRGVGKQHTLKLVTRLSI